MKVSTVVVLGFCFLAGLPLVAQDFSNVEIKATHVAGRVYMLEGAGGNIGVSVGEDGLLIVDDQFAPLADKIRAALKDLGEGDLEFVLNTHWHGDHTGGNVEFGEESHIIAHTNVRQRMSSEQRSPRGVTPASPGVALPVITFDDSLSIHFNGEEIKAIHYPRGHTDGDSVIHFVGSNVIHMGDHFFSGRFPFVDLASGGNAVGFAKNVGSVLEKLPPGVKIIPGHGPLSSADDLKLFHRMLNDTIDTVRKAKDAGKSLEEIQAAGLSDEWDGWGSGFINENVWIQIIYGSL